MKFYRPLLLALIDCLSLVFNENKIASHVLESTFKKNKKWGSKDRKMFAESFYEIIKWQLLIKLNLTPRFEVDWANIVVYYLISFGYSLEDFLGWSSDKQKVLYNVSEFARKNPFDPNLFLKNDKLTIYERYSFPLEFHEKAKSEVSDLEDFYRHSQDQAPLFIRANTNINSLEQLKIKLQEENIETITSSNLPFGLRLKEKINIFKTQAFKTGGFEVQDGGSQSIASFLQVSPGHFVVDACAGAGGKTLHLSNLMENKGRIVSLDIYAWKLEELKRRARRNQCHNIEVKHIENNKVIKRLKGKADRLLLDVPCSGSGVLRRNPDAKYKSSKNFFNETEELQKSILFNYSEILKSGGKLVYSTCSAFHSENKKQIEVFLGQNPDWTLEAERVIKVGENDFDGYYMARLVKP